MTDRELMQQALRYMESIGEMDTYPEDWAIAIALRERLAQPEQEPVAWMGVYDRTDLYYRKPPQADVIPLYTAPPPRQWQGLTDEELNQIYAEPQTHAGQYARAIEAKLKEKNT